MSYSEFDVVAILISFFCPDVVAFFVLKQQIVIEIFDIVGMRVVCLQSTLLSNWMANMGKPSKVRESEGQFRSILAAYI